MTNDSRANAGPSADRPFRWRSKLGIATAIFLLYGIFLFGAAIVVPWTLHREGVGGMMGTIVSMEADSKVLGRPLAQIAASDPALGSYIVAYMDTMCMEMMAFGILQLGVVWFGLRRGHVWALWAVAVADLSFIPYLLAWARIFSRAGVSFTEVATSFNGFWIILVVGVLLGVLMGQWGLRRQGREQPAPA